MIVKKFMNKKGAITDTIFVPIFLLILVITTFVGLYVWISFQAAMTTTVANTAANATVVNAMNDIRTGLNTFDYVFPILFVGLLLMSLIFAFKTGSSVIYAFLSLILWGFALLMSAVITNIFSTFLAGFPAEISTQYSIMTYMLLNIKWIVLAWLFLISAIMFTRTKREDQNLAASEMAFG